MRKLMKSLAMAVAAVVDGAAVFYGIAVTHSGDCLWGLVLLWPITYFAWKAETNQVPPPTEPNAD
jgi:hypothetical protein